MKEELEALLKRLQHHFENLLNNQTESILQELPTFEFYMNNILNIIYYDSIWSLNHNKKSLIETDCIAIGIELCNIPQISEHCPKNVPGRFT